MDGVGAARQQAHMTSHQVVELSLLLSVLGNKHMFSATPRLRQQQQYLTLLYRFYTEHNAAIKVKLRIVSVFSVKLKSVL